eukprot:CAMPEP_0168749090 /NCGR_PEP_ID=MMETSP0724-20121128/16526_1 /TAXON_ID=265536 /ORGANISM="Amphiprora sp., Strain CCMP467" /LENGTH=251 /DNA_ID=CAMNT_0008796967 /DNA_START=313 /DNA_END=1068 /DNA_ORIENTATION=+
MSPGSDDVGRRNKKRQQKQKQGTPLRVDLETMQAGWQALIDWVRTTFQNRVRLDTLRPLPQFLGISVATGCLHGEAFSPPVRLRHLDKSAAEKIKSRFSLNFQYFITNYVLIALLVATVVALMHPGMVLFVGVLYALWTAHTAWGYQELFMFGVELHVYLTYPLRSNVLTALTLLVVIWKCFWPAIHAVVISTLLIAAHALLRDPKHIDLTVGDEQLEDDYTGPLATDDNDEEGGMSSSDSSAVLVERPKQ